MYCRDVLGQVVLKRLVGHLHVDDAEFLLVCLLKVPNVLISHWREGVASRRELVANNEDW